MFYKPRQPYFRYLMIAFLAMALNSCRNNTQDQSKQEPTKQSFKKEALIEANRSAIAAEKEMIKSYAQRHNWILKQASGIYYLRYENGNGKSISPGDRVKYHFTLSLINGSVVSSSSKGNPELIHIASGGSVVSGLHKGMMQLYEGDKAKLIVPSHLAYGIAGDQRKIPSKSTLIYDLEILEVASRSNP